VRQRGSLTDTLSPPRTNVGRTLSSRPSGHPTRDGIPHRPSYTGLYPIQAILHGTVSPGPSGIALTGRRACRMAVPSGHPTRDRIPRPDTPEAGPSWRCSSGHPTRDCIPRNPQKSPDRPPVASFGSDHWTTPAILHGTVSPGPPGIAATPRGDLIRTSI